MTARITILNAGGQTDYLYGLVSGLAEISEIHVEVIDSDNAEGLFDQFANVTFLNLRGSLDPQRRFVQKLIGLLRYYARLLLYASRTESRVIHIQWENRFLTFDRTILNLIYKMLGKRIVFTAHNVDPQGRAGNSSGFNRSTLRFMYQVVDRVIVHTAKMKHQLSEGFSIPRNKIHVIPHGINNKVKRAGISQGQARRALHIRTDWKVLLFFGRITPYKGLDVLIRAFHQLVGKDSRYFLMIAGREDGCPDYLREARELMVTLGVGDRIMLREEFIPDVDIETYFMGADCLILPYRDIFQSGVIFLSYAMGLPIVATDVGSFREDIVDGKTGFLCRPGDPKSMADTVQLYFESELYLQLSETRSTISSYAENRYSWRRIAQQTVSIYNDCSE